MASPQPELSFTGARRPLFLKFSKNLRTGLASSPKMPTFASPKTKGVGFSAGAAYRREKISKKDLRNQKK